jgi:N-acetylglucosamine-6-sulfatase
LSNSAGGASPPWREYLLQEYEGDALQYAAVRTSAGETYAERYTPDEFEHYRADDPDQLENDYPNADPARISELAGRLKALKACSGAGCRGPDGGRRLLLAS